MMIAVSYFPPCLWMSTEHWPRPSYYADWDFFQHVQPIIAHVILKKKVFFWNKYFVIWSRRIDWNLLIMLIETSFKLWTPATNHYTCHFENTVFNWNRYFVNCSKYLGFTDTGRHFVSDDWVLLQQLPCRLCNKSRQLSHLVDFWLDSSLKEFKRETSTSLRNCCLVSDE